MSLPQTMDMLHERLAKYQQLNYQLEGKRVDLPPDKRIVFEFIKTIVRIPPDFDDDVFFGPISGICHEERVVSAYIHGQFPESMERGEPSVRQTIRAFVIEGAWTKASEYVRGLTTRVSY